MKGRAGIAMLAFVAVGCGGGGDGGTNPPPGGGPPPGGNQCTSTATNVTVANNNFSPRCTTVPTGTTVTWTWDSGGTLHNVTFTSGASSGDQGTGTFQRAFPTAGTFAYECSIHGAAMTGEVRVQ
jgi:plastocyanin